MMLARKLAIAMLQYCGGVVAMLLTMGVFANLNFHT
jgi:hypothetical protein